MNQESKRAIVCVDDDPFILQMLGFQLNKIVYPKDVLLELYTNPAEVIECMGLLREEGIVVKLLFVDYNMPQMTGAELIRAVKQYDASIVCVMLSGEADSREVDELREMKLIDSFVSKPWNESTLVSILEQVI